MTQRSEVVEFDAHMFNGGIINSGKIEKHIYELRPLRNAAKFYFWYQCFTNIYFLQHLEDRSRSKPGDVGIDRKLKPVPKQINKRTLKVVIMEFMKKLKPTLEIVQEYHWNNHWKIYFDIGPVFSTLFSTTSIRKSKGWLL